MTHEQKFKNPDDAPKVEHPHVETDGDGQSRQESNPPGHDVGDAEPVGGTGQV
jgi:hypothetical protein